MDEYKNALDDPGAVGVPIHEVGTSAAPMRDQLDELKAKIRSGISKVELGFWGSGKGTAEQPTPGQYGQDQRDAIRELAQVNNVELTTHATPNLAPISGIGREGYSDDQRKMAVDEIKRAIDFAADVAEGGAVVFHVGEYQRPVSEAGLDNGEKLDMLSGEKDPRFAEHDDYRHTAQFAVVDARSKQVSQGAVPTDREFFAPMIDQEGNVKTYEGDDIPEGKNPGDPMTEKYTWDDIIKRTKEHNERVRKKEFSERDELNGTKFAEEEITPSEYFQVKQLKDRIFGLKGQRAYYQDILENTKARERQIKSQGDETDTEVQSQLRQNKETQNNYLQAIAQSEGQEREFEQQIESLESLEKFSNKQTSKSLSELGMYTMAQQEAKEKQGRTFEKDLFVAPENVFPESYGAHPEELIRIIKDGRKQLAKDLQHRKGMGEQEAREEASKRIRATFDIAHAHLWKRYFNPKEGEDPEEAYKEWYFGQLKKMKDADILGHVHVSDNFGYHDEHVTPGQGNLPVKEIVEELKKNDVDFIVETGRQGDQALFGAWKEFGSPIYGLSRPKSADPWSVIESSYFGTTAPPYFVVGQYAQEFGERVGKDFSAWSGVPFE